MGEASLFVMLASRRKWKRQGIEFEKTLLLHIHEADSPSTLPTPAALRAPETRFRPRMLAWRQLQSALSHKGKEDYQGDNQQTNLNQKHRTILKNKFGN